MLDVEERARRAGFESAVPISPGMVECKEELRELCAPEACPEYASCWSCPPGAGPFAECAARIAAKSGGVLVQTVREGVDFSDAALLEEVKAVHHGRLDRLADEVRAVHAGALEFSTGGCDVCGTCTYPDAPCKEPGRQRLALSAHGVDVAATCGRAHMEYGFEDGTIRYVGMILY